MFTGVILAAGIGWRLGGGEGQLPKCLIRFEGRTLLERHLRAMLGLGIDRVVLGVGYQHEQIAAHVAELGIDDHVDLVFNPDFREGNIVTLWHLREALVAGGDVILTDADVLYERSLLERLVSSRLPDCLLLDRDIEPGDEPVKICVRDGVPVEFGKAVPASLAYDYHGESVGFFKLSAATARTLAGRAGAYVDAGRREAFYEDALRDLIVEGVPRFGFEDITGTPWIEIDFQEDIARAEREVMLRIQAVEAA